jgi:hypothetical protein
MEKQISTSLKRILIAALSVFIISPLLAQDNNQLVITKDQINKINELVKPLRDQLEKQLNGDETYKAYAEDIKKLNSTKNFEEKSSLTKMIKEKYSAYFQKIWAVAKVDEKSYRLKIRRIFPDNLANQLQFEPCLVFTLNTSLTPVQPPASEPPNKCLDICSIAGGEITGNSTLIAAGGGSYGNCFLRTNAWGAVFGMSSLYGFLRNNITIPGTLPNDSRKLRVVKTYQLMQEATSFAVIGGGYAETWARTYKSSEYMLVYSPVVFGSSAFKIKSMNENYLLEKKDVALSIFKTYAQTFSAFVSGNWCYSSCFAIRWSICEEK